MSCSGIKPAVLFCCSTLVMDRSLLLHQYQMPLLAALAVSSTRNRSLQTRLEAVLRRELINIMLLGEKNLDLLAALLGYVGWGHFFSIPRKDSFKQFMALATSICDELGFGLLSEEAASQGVMRLHLEHNECSRTDAQRLYLGVYFISSWSALIGLPCPLC